MCDVTYGRYTEVLTKYMTWSFNSSILHLKSYIFKVEVGLSTYKARHILAGHATKKRETGDKLVTLLTKKKSV